MQFKDYYQVLGVARDAGHDDIKRAYRKLARKYHPDVSKEPDAEARFKEVGEAYEVLKDPEKRAAYDQFGEQWRAGEVRAWRARGLCAAALLIVPGVAGGLACGGPAGPRHAFVARAGRCYSAK